MPTNAPRMFCALSQTAMIIVVMASVTGLGCFTSDPTRTTRQTISLRVVDASSGNPIGGAAIEFKFDFDRYESINTKTQALPKEIRDNSRENWERRRWASCVTDRDGHTEAAVTTTAIDRTPANTKPPSNRDITGVPYLFKVKVGDEPEEILSLVVKRGETGTGRRFKLTVIDIGELFYIEATSPR